MKLAELSKIKSGEVTNQALKVIYYLKPQANVSRDDFRQLIDGPYSALMIRQELLSLHLRSYCIPVDPAQFVNSSFEKAKISQYGIIDELWFKNMETLQNFHQELKPRMHQQLSEGIDFNNSFSLIVSDRVVFGARP